MKKIKLTEDDFKRLCSDVLNAPIDKFVQKIEDCIDLTSTELNDFLNEWDKEKDNLN